MSLNGMTCIPEGKFWIVEKRSQTNTVLFSSRGRTIFVMRMLEIG